MFEVTVKTLDGKSKVLQVENEDLTVLEFKEMVSTELEIPIELQRLIFQGKALLDDKKLTEYGVQSKTIHLVSRPPPTADQNAASTSEANREFASVSQHGSQFVPNLAWFPIQGIQRAAQNITQGMLSGMVDLGRPSNIVMRSDNDGNMDIHMNLPFLGRRDNQFRRLHKMATNLLNSIEGRDRSNQQSDVSTTPLEESTQSQTQGPSEATREAGITTLSENALTTTDPNEESTTDRQPSTEDRQNVPSPPQNVSLNRLADMLSDQRRLWTQMEPHLDRWENMLRTEQALHDSLTESAETSAEVRKPEPMEITDSTPALEWSQRSFNEIGRLLHLQSHMLHLLSDFGVGTDRETPTTNTQAASSATNPIEVTATIDAPEVTSPAVTSQLPPTRPRRIVTVPERDTPVVHAHINIEPTTVTFARPLGRRSQSAHPDPNAPINSDANLPTAFIIEGPVDAPAEQQSRSIESDQTNNLAASSANALNALSRDMLSFIEMASSPSGAVNVQPSPISATTTAQSPETNTTTGDTTQPASTGEANSTAEASLLQQLSRSFGNLVGANQAASVAAEPQVASVAAEPQVAMATPIFLPQFGTSSSVSVDPFLPCYSRHFTNSLRQTRGRRPTARVSERNVRRGRSAGPNSSDPTQRQAPTVNITDLPSHPNRQPNMAATVHSVTIPLGSTFSLNGTGRNLSNLASIGDQVQRALAESLSGQGINIFAGPTQVSTQQSGGASTHISAGVNTINPLSWVLNFGGSGGIHTVGNPARPPPTPDETYQELTGETTLSQFPAVLMEGIIRTVWSFIVDLARNTSKTPPPIDASNWSASPANSEPTSPFHQSFLRLRENLRAGGFLSIPPTAPETRMHNCVDGLRQPLRRLLPSDFMSGRDAVRDSLTRSLLSNRVTDVNNTDPNEVALAQWALDQGTRTTPIDLRRSLYNFLTHRVMSQMTMWRESPTNSGFGSLLMVTLNQMGLDLFGFADLLAKVAAERLGFTLNEGANNVGGRSQTFGHSMSLEPLLRHVDTFISSLPDDSNDRRVLKFLRSGLVQCITTYCGLSSHGLSRYMGVPMSLIVFREEGDVSSSLYAGVPSATAINMAPPSDLNRQKLKNGQRMENFEDSDSSDVYEDAHEGPQASSSVYTVSDEPTSASNTPEPQQPIKTSTNFSMSRSLVPSLPQWHLVSGQTVPNSTSEALAPNPALMADWDNQLPATSGDIPPQWMEIVANDVAHMTRDADAGGTDDDVLHYRLSDAYIAGMPAKRRRVMLEKKESLLCPIGNMFSSLMSEAILATEHGSPQPSNNIAPALSSFGTDQGDRSALHAADVSTPELRETMKAFIVDYFAKRLSSDPDFEPNRYPAAKGAFAKKSDK